MSVTRAVPRACPRNFRPRSFPGKRNDIGSAVDRKFSRASALQGARKKTTAKLSTKERGERQLPGIALSSFTGDLKINFVNSIT